MFRYRRSDRRCSGRSTFATIGFGKSSTVNMNVGAEICSAPLARRGLSALKTCCVPYVEHIHAAPVTEPRARRYSDSWPRKWWTGSPHSPFIRKLLKDFCLPDAKEISCFTDRPHQLRHLTRFPVCLSLIFSPAGNTSFVVCHRFVFYLILSITTYMLLLSMVCTAAHHLAGITFAGQCPLR